MEKYKQEIKKDTENTKEKIKIKKEELRKNFDVELAQLKNIYFTQKKDELLQKTIEKAFNVFCEEREETYIRFVLNLLNKNIPKEKSKIFFGEKDYEKFKNKILKDNIKIEKTLNFKYGFKIESEKYLLNFDMKEIFTQNIEQLKKIALEALDIKDVLNWKKTLILLL